MATTTLRSITQRKTIPMMCASQHEWLSSWSSYDAPLGEEETIQKAEDGHSCGICTDGVAHLQLKEGNTCMQILFVSVPIIMSNATAPPYAAGLRCICPCACCDCCIGRKSG
eukprot:4224054-Amphidinium_carterae.1